MNWALKGDEKDLAKSIYGGGEGGYKAFQALSTAKAKALRHKGA